MTEQTSNGRRFSAAAGNEFWDVQALRSEFGTAREPVKIIMHERQMPDPRARFAMACIERWGMVCAMPDGEDSGGRQKLRPATVSEITEHACACAEAAYDQFQKRGWFIAVPSYQELVDSVKDQENGND